MESNCDNDTKPKSSILIIGESNSVRQYMKESLGNAGFDVSAVSGARAGFNQLVFGSFDVVLVDMNMPDMNGLELITGLQHNEHMYSIILMSSNPSNEEKVAGMESGADDYISKPFSTRELITRVRVGARNARIKKNLAQARDSAANALQSLLKTNPGLLEEQSPAVVAELLIAVAHQINSPLSYIRCNMNTFMKYSRVLFEGIDRLVRLADMFQTLGLSTWESVEAVLQWGKKARLNFIREDVELLAWETMEGLNKIDFILKCLLVMTDTNVQENSLRDVNEILKSQLDPFLSSLPKGVSLVSSYSPSALVVQCKDGQLNAAIKDMLDDAAAAVGARGIIEVKTFQEEGYACIEVKNAKNEISPNEIHSVFGDFFTSKTYRRGAGLGLAISRYCVLSHRGKIEMRPEPGGGARVTMRLPM